MSSGPCVMFLSCGLLQHMYMCVLMYGDVGFGNQKEPMVGKGGGGGGGGGKKTYSHFNHTWYN